MFLKNNFNNRHETKIIQKHGDNYLNDEIKKKEMGNQLQLLLCKGNL